MLQSFAQKALQYGLSHHSSLATELSFALGADVNATDEKGNTLLHLAKDEVTVNELIARGANVQAENHNNDKPLHLAQNANVAQALLHAGASVRSLNNQCSTPLHLAQDVNIVQVLLRAGADVQAQNHDGHTPLHLAKNPEIARALLNGRAKVHGRKRHKETPLHRHVAENNAAIVQVLIDHKADIHAKDNPGHTPLHLAKTADIAIILLDNGAKVDAVTWGNETPLHLAQNVEVTQVLLAYGASVHARTTYTQHKTPLHFARDVSLARLLILAGANVHARNNQKQTPLHFCQNADIAREFILAGAQVDAQDNSGNTRLHTASRLNTPESLELVQALIRSGANVSATNHSGYSPLHLAKNPLVAKMLIVAGARVNVAALSDGNTPLHVADNVEVTRVLLQAGATVNSTNRDAQTPLMFANQNRNEAIFQELLAYDTLPFVIHEERIINQLNPRQSVHETSVHKYISETATELMAYYPDCLKEDLRSIEEWLEKLNSAQDFDAWQQQWVNEEQRIRQKNNLPLLSGAQIQQAFQLEKLKRISARNGFHRILALPFKEGRSDISFSQALAMTWLSLNDKDALGPNCKPLADQDILERRRRLLDALYRCQREYHLDANEKDDMRPERNDPNNPSFSCDNGCFNFIIDTNTGSHFKAADAVVVNAGRIMAFAIATIYNELAELPLKERAQFASEWNQEAEIPAALWRTIEAHVQSKVQVEFKGSTTDPKLPQWLAAVCYRELKYTPFYPDRLKSSLRPLEIEPSRTLTTDFDRRRTDGKELVDRMETDEPEPSSQPSEGLKRARR